MHATLAQSFVIAAFVGAALSFLLAVICTSGGYQLQGFMGLACGLAITCLYALISILRLLPSLA
jgi:uncharacterized membrane protein (GlpM family)